MGTEIYVSVTVAQAPAGLAEKLPNWELLNAEHWDNAMVWDEEQRTHLPLETSYYTNGTASYEDACTIEAWAPAFTKEHPGASVRFYQEWYGDGENQQSVDIYRDGELVRAESKVNAMVPLDLDELLAKAKLALQTYDETETAYSALPEKEQDGRNYEDYEDSILTSAPDLAETLRALVEGLE